MSEPSIQSTFVVERTYPVPPSKVFEAFTDPGVKRRWFAEGLGHDVEHFETDGSVGGVERLRYRLNETSPFPGLVIEFDGRILDIVTDERIVAASSMAFQGKCVSAALVTVEFTPTGEGTAVVCTHHGAYFEGADGPQIREGGWQKLFDKLGAALTGG